MPILFADKDDTAARKAERDKMWTYGRRLVWPSLDAIRQDITASDNWVHKRLRVDRFAVMEGGTAHPVNVHIHAHYLDDLGGDLLYYKALREADRIVVTTDTDSKADRIHQIAQDILIVSTIWSCKELRE